MSNKKVILLNIDLVDSGFSDNQDLTCCYLPEVLIEEYIKAGGKLQELKAFDKSKTLRVDGKLIELVEKYHDEIRELEGTLERHKKNIEFRPDKGNNYDFKRFRIGEVRTNEKFAITHPYDDAGSKEKIVYFKDFDWLCLLE